MSTFIFKKVIITYNIVYIYKIQNIIYSFILNQIPDTRRNILGTNVRLT